MKKLVILVLILFVFQMMGCNGTIKDDTSDATTIPITTENYEPTFEITTITPTTSEPITEEPTSETITTEDLTIEILFDSNGGSEVDGYKVEIGDFITKPTTERPGYVFKGWFSSSDQGSTLDQLWDFDLMSFNQSLVLYADWEPIEYKVTYDIYHGYFDSSYNISLGIDESIISIAQGLSHTVMLTSQGRVFTMGEKYINGSKYYFGDLLRPYEMTDLFNLHENEIITSIYAGRSVSFALSSNNRLFAWGSNDDGEQGVPAIDTSYTPKEITYRFNLNENELITYLYTDENTVGLLTSDGRVFTWGRNSKNTLGDGSEVNKSYDPIDITSFFNFNENEKPLFISFSFYSAILVTSENRIFTWGDGSGDRVSSLFPRDVSDLFTFNEDEVITYIEISGDESTFFTSQNRIICWGGTTFITTEGGYTYSANRSIPEDITGLFRLDEDEVIEMISVGSAPKLAYTSFGRLFMWGWDPDETVDYSSMTEIYYPRLVNNKEGITSDIELMSARYYSVFVYNSNGVLIAYGHNRYGKLGVGSEDELLISTKRLGFKNITVSYEAFYHYGDIHAEIESTPGFDIQAWYLYDGQEIAYSFGNEVTDNIRLYAYAYPKTYDVYCYMDDSENPVKIGFITMFHGTSLMADPTKYGFGEDGYTFDGYYDNPEFTGEKIIYIEPGVEDVILYAKWIPND